MIPRRDIMLKCVKISSIGARKTFLLLRQNQKMMEKIHVHVFSFISA